MFKPEIKIEKFDMVDVITTSTGGSGEICPEDYDNWVWEYPCL